MSCGGICNHDHDSGEEFIIIKQIDLSKIRCLNAITSNNAYKIFKSYDKRMENEPFIESHEGDPELLLHVTFSEAVKIKSFCVIGATEELSPTKINIFTNRNDIDFNNIETLAPTQSVELIPNCDLWYLTRYSKFQNIHELDIHLKNSFGEEQIKLIYIGFNGQGTGMKRDVVKCNYEAIATSKTIDSFNKSTLNIS